MQRLLFFLGSLALSLFAAAAPLPSFKIDLHHTPVSGISSGGFMAVQFSVAYSSLVEGAGIVAGGPFYCARGDIATATTLCSCTGVPFISSCQVTPGGTRVDQLLRITDNYARRGAIDAPSHLARQKIWLFSGTADSVVPTAVMGDLETFYRHYIPAAQIAFKHDLPAEHAMPTDSYGRACDHLGEPYINRCHFDAAGALLQWILGVGLRPRSTSPGGMLLAFEQAEFFANGDAPRSGMAERGYVYVPGDCAQMQQCRLHVVFHGCHQNQASIGEQFVRHAGYNAWADTNRILILYPQTSATLANPNACWDWFDASGEDPAYATRDGRQMRAVRAMIDRLAGLLTPAPAQRCITATNHAHVQAGRAYTGWFLIARATGSNDYLGFDSIYTNTTLRQTGPGNYAIGGCP